MRYLLTLILLISFNVQGAEIQIPALRAPVMDEANVLTDAQEADLNQLAYEINTNQGPQITIFTVNDMQGNVIEEFSIRVGEKWQLGTKDRDNGLLIIIAKAERQMRIEVGNGIEGEITDYDSSQYIRNILTPAFKAGDFHGGLKTVMLDVAQKFNIQLNEGTRFVRRSSPPRVVTGPFVIFLPILLLILIVGQLLLRKRPMVRGLFSGVAFAGAGAVIGVAGLAVLLVLFLIGLFIGMIGLQNLLYALAAGQSHRRGGFGGGGFGGGGGGWSGGGGGFSGGGSSGSW